MPHKLKIQPRKYNTFYLKKLHGLLQAVNDKQALVSFRHSILSRQKAINHQNESDKEGHRSVQIWPGRSEGDYHNVVWHSGGGGTHCGRGALSSMQPPTACSSTQGPGRGWQASRSGSRLGRSPKDFRINT